MSTTGPISLPMELQQRIIIIAISLDRNDWPRRTLTTYCLVSKAFLHMTRSHFFPTVELHMLPKIKSFQDIMTSSHMTQWTIAPYIHKVRIRMTPANDTLIMSMLSVVPSMLNMWDLTIRCNNPPLPEIHRVWPNVFRLRLETPTAIDSFANLSKLVVGFTKLESLHLDQNNQTYRYDYDHWGISSNASHMSIPHRAKFIEFRDVKPELSGAIMRNHNDIERLIIHELSPVSLKVTQNSINECGDSLLELMMNAGCTDLWPRELSLARAMYLKKLTLWSGFPASPLLSSYTQFLQTLNSHHLVFIYIHLAEYLVEAERDLTLLDSIVPKSVKNFTLDVIDAQGLPPVTPEWDGRESWVRLHLPVCDSRGILKVVFHLVQRPSDIVDTIYPSRE